MASDVYDKEEVLDGELRDYISHAFIEFLFLKGICIIHAEDFQFMVKTIAKLFPTESHNVSGYYQISGKPNVAPTGRLYRDYTFYRGMMLKRGLVSKIKSGRPTSSSPVQNDLPEEVTADETQLEAELHSMIEPWSDVESSWKKTFRFRRNKLKVEKINPLQYLNLYPAMKSSHSKSLVSSIL